MKKPKNRKRYKNGILLTDKELAEKHISEMGGILTEILDYFGYANYFNNAPTEKHKMVIQYNTNIRFFRGTIEQMLVIELHKLFSKSGNDEFSFDNLFKNLQGNGNYWNLDYDSNVIEGWKQKIEAKKEIRKIIWTMRDKFYAHNDENRLFDSTFNKLFHKPFPIYEEIKSLIELSISILNKLSIDLFYDELKIHYVHFRPGELNRMIEILADAEGTFSADPASTVSEIKKGKD